MKKIYLAIVSVLFFATSGLGQVELIVPAGDGGFENGTTFAASNWTLVSGTTNSWADGALPAAVFAGTRAAYVSKDLGTTNLYTLTTVSTSHFYRDVFVPAGATFITLSFEMKGSGEVGTDRLLVYTAPTTVTPAAGVPVSPSAVLPGATLVFQQAANNNTYALITVPLPNGLAGTTVRLIFTWQNNGSAGTQTPAAVDNISLTYMPPAPPTITSFLATSACLGTTPTITITGTNFGATSAVKFSGVDATSFTVVNFTTITAVLPASGVSTGPISVTTPQGGTVISGTNFTVNPPATTGLTYPDLTPAYCVGAAIPDNIPTHGGGAPVNYTVSGLPAGLGIDPATGTISGTPTAAGSGTYTVTANNPPCGSSSVNLDITVTTPITSITYSTNPAVYCASVAIAANNPNPVGGTSNSYSVSPGLPPGLTLNPLTGVITGTPTTTTGVPAANYRVTAINSCSSPFVDINITISPEKPVAPGSITGAASQCPGHTGQVYSIPGTVPNATTYTWNVPTGWIINTGGGTISITVTAGAVGDNGNITVSADNSCGQSPLSTFAVTVTATPTATAGGPDFVCESGTPATVILSGASISGGAPGTWSYGTGGGTLSSTSTTNIPDTISFSPPPDPFFGPITITLTPDVASGCPAATPVTRNITVNQAATLVPGGEDNICQSASPTPYTLVGASLGGSATGATWTINAPAGGTINPVGSTPTPATTTYTPVANFNGVVLLTLTSNDPDGAGSTGPCPAVAVTRVVNINAGPAITSLTATPASLVCTGGTTSSLKVTAPPSGGSDILTTENFNGTPTFTVAGTSVALGSASIWTKRASGYNATGIGTFTNNIDGSSFMLTNFYAFLFGTTKCTLTSPLLNTTNYTSLSLTFQHTYKPGLNNPSFANVEVSTNGGTSWIVVKPYPAVAIGGITNFLPEIIDLSAYINQPTFKFRFNYSASILAFALATSWWAIDNVQLTGIANNYQYSWTALPAGPSAGLPAGAGIPTVGSANNPITVTPTVTTDYTVTETNFSSCPTTQTVTVSVSAAPTSATASFPTICAGGSTVLTLNGGGGGGVTETINWYTGSCGGALVHTGNNWLVSPGVTTTYFGRYGNSTCPSFGTACQTVTVTVGATPGTWLGKTSDWNDGQNWCTGTPPTSVTNVTIPVTANNPVVSTAVAQAQNLTINAGATLTVTGNTLQVSRNIANSGTLTATNGTIEFNGTAAQTTATAAFATGTVKDLVISNPAGVTLGAPLNITNSLTFGPPANSTLLTSGNLTLKSSATGTAWVGNMTGKTITGDVTVERYIASGTNHAKSWQLLAIPTIGPTPTTGQNIKNAWQEGAAVVNGNPNPGFGTMLTSDVAGATTQLLPGFDALTTPGPSIKVYNTLTGAYDGPLNTGIAIYNKKGYFVLVRGDRSRITSVAPANPTILRTKGALLTPANGPFFGTVGGAQFESVGNPYASAIDLRTLAYGAGINTTVIVWDPTIGGSYGLGAFQTLFLSGGNYVNLLTSSAYGPAGTSNNFIQSGQAFIIQGVGAGGTLTFAESNKAPGSNPLLLIPQRIVAEQPQLHANLYGINADASTFLTDGALIQYDKAYSNTLDTMDARKMTNTSENLSVKSGGKDLVVERRQPIAQSDTVFYDLTGVRVQSYRFEFIANGLGGSGLDGFLEDTYLHTKTPLDLGGTTLVNFTIENIAGSYAADRFRIVFAPTVVLPVTFTSVKAYRQDKNINVEWRVENERNMKQYEVEKSTNGTQFTSIAVKAATANNGGSAVYVIADVNPAEGFNYYRVKSVDVNDKLSYTNVVKVLIGSMKQDITIYPNPITDGMIHLQLMNMPEGKYKIRLLNKLGQLIVQKQITHAGGSATELIKWDYKLAHGMYQLEVTKPDGTVKDLNVMY